MPNETYSKQGDVRTAYVGVFDSIILVVLVVLNRDTYRDMNDADDLAMGIHTSPVANSLIDVHDFQTVDCQIFI
jgi:hypothetical protein